MPNANRGIKRRRTFTLSPESLAYLDEQARQRKLGSQSAFLDELLREKTMELRRAALEANVTAYYDSLSEEERQEQRAWGELAEQSLALREDEAPYDQPTQLQVVAQFIPASVAARMQEQIHATKTKK